MSLCKLVNLLSLLLLCACCKDELLGGNSYTEFIVVLGIIVYGLSLRWIGTKIDIITEMK